MIFILILVLILVGLGATVALLWCGRWKLKSLVFAAERARDKALESKLKAERAARKEHQRAAELNEQLANVVYALQRIDGVTHGVADVNQVLAGVSRSLLGVGQEVHDLVGFIAELAGAEVEPGRHAVAPPGMPEIAAAPGEDMEEAAPDVAMAPHIHVDHVDPPVVRYPDLNGATISNNPGYYVVN